MTQSGSEIPEEPTLPEKTRPENILIFDKDSEEIHAAINRIVEQLPKVNLTRVHSLDHYRDIIKSADFDIVILDYEISGDRGVELIHELKLKDYEPAVLIVSNSVESKVFTEIYNSGCHRYIIKNGRWLEEIGPAVRHLLRIRKLENENRSLLSRLTEANIMLAEKNKRLDEFSATLAHDIRGPLGGICMKLEYILESHSDGLGGRVKDLIHRAYGSAERLTHIVQAMYDFAKLGSKAAKMEFVNLKQLVEEVILDIAFEDTADIQIGIDDLPVVWGNPDLLRRVFINLISNAVKYSDKKEIVVNVGVRGVSNRTLAKFTEIFVEDNGPGIPKEDQKDIFQIFNRGQQHGGPKEGIGLGLSVVQRIVELHFGKVSVESQSGRGTTFVLTLPMEEINFLR